MKKDSDSEEDLALFHEAMKDVKPLKASNKHQLKKPRNKLPARLKYQTFEQEEMFEDFLSDELKETLTSDDKLFFAKTGLQQNTVKELRLGKIRPEDMLDLHRLTVTMARKAITKFIAENVNRKSRCVLIIHGKGKFSTTIPVLKNHVNHWLKQHPAVLAFCSATLQDGGVGAVYVLLKRSSHKYL